MPNRIYWFAFYDMRSPSVRYRGYHILKELELQKGVRAHFFTPSWRFLSVFRFLWFVLSIHFRSRNRTRVIIQRVHSDGVYARALKFLVANNRSICFYDLDDAQYEECDPKNLHWFLENVKGVFVGSSALKSYCSKFNSNVKLLTSATTNHHFVKKSRNQVFKVGWIGNFWGQHERNMYELFLPSLKLLSSNILLEIVGVVHQEKEEKLRQFFSDSENIQLSIPRSVNWQDDLEVYQLLSSHDLGVSPLLDTEINRCKSAYKLKQHLSCGVPVIGSSIGENSRFIRDGANGFICNSQEDYVERIVQFQRMSSDQYASYSENAINSKEAFELSVVAQEFYGLL